MAIALTLLFAPVQAFAQSPAPAPAGAAAERAGREHFGRGLVLYREGNFGGARAEFQRAYDIAPSYRILFNVGEGSFELQDYAGAIAAFRRYLDEGGSAIPAARRAEVEQTLALLEQRVGRLVVTTNVAGAEIAVDGVRVGVSPLATPVVVSVGRRTLTAMLPGRMPASRTLDVAGGDRSEVALDLALPVVAVPNVPAPPPELPPTEVLPAPAPLRVSTPTRSATPFWIGVAATGALAATSAVFGVLTIESNSTLSTRLGQFPGSASGIASARSDVHAFALAADVLGATAIAAAGVTVYLGVSRRAPTSVGLELGAARLRVMF